MGELLWTIDDVAEATRFSDRTIRRLRAANKLPQADFVYGRCPRWRPESINRWIAGGGLESVSN